MHNLSTLQSVTNLDINEKAGFAMQYELNQKYSDKNKVRFLKCDITDEHQHIDTLQNLLVDRRKTYVIVNNAGLIEQRPDMSKEAIDSNVVSKLIHFKELCPYNEPPSVFV